MKRYCLASILALVMAILLIATPAYATELPSSTPTATFYVYRNLLEPADWLILIYQDIPYTTIPDEPISETFMWRLMKTDNVTELGTALSYAYNGNGYGYNLTSMYINSANASSAGMVWGASYPLKLSGNPTVFASPPEYNFTLSHANYSTLTDSDDEKAELAVRLLLIGGNLDIRWGLGATYSLLNETETGTVFSIYGEAFFRGAIYGLQGLCPQVFAYVISDLDITPRTWSDSYVTTLETQYAGTWVDTAKAAGATLFGTGFDLTALIITLIAAAGIAIATIVLSGDAWHGLADARTTLIGFTRLGFFNLGFLGLLAALAVIYGAARIWRVLS